MAATVADVISVDAPIQACTDAVPSRTIFPFLKLPRELREIVYDYAFQLEDDRSERAIRIERRHLKYFKPSAAAILLVLHHEYLLLNRQVAREALEILFKRHVVFLSCGPFVLKTLFEKIEEPNGPGRQWLRWMKDIELDWVTFPNLAHYPPDRESGRDEWYWEQEQQEMDVDHVRGAQYNGHYDEYDHEGRYYDDNAYYDPSDTTLYPSFQPPPAAEASDPSDPFGFASHYPFADPSDEPTQDSSTYEEISTKLDLLVQMEVTPLFTYLASPTFNLTSITLPLYFISKESHHNRSTTRPGYALPLKIRYWVHLCVHAIIMLGTTSASSSATPSLQMVRVKYLPWDIWASMDPADDLCRMTEKGVWFDDAESAEGGERQSEGEAFRAVWDSLRKKAIYDDNERMGLHAEVRFVQWDGNVDSWRVGDELEVMFTRRTG
ncbi:hypothetical protein FB567DRAFT_61842 [Paraphoma chrysanthemicola]|uniref:F-box domain-containing protein n=1 Tax=Paraphoma chrysanthemicola TaxID=798071 RepID=A0A8K0VYU8_9PLEO|nr:hypothetical protein FB567DRAFT_61842 [Paraphoma chrysanthemicola]